MFSNNSLSNWLFSPIRPEKGIKILTPENMLQRLPIAHAKVKASNTSENLLNEIRQIIYLYRSKGIIKNYTTIKWIRDRYNRKWILYLWILITEKLSFTCCFK